MALAYAPYTYLSKLILGMFVGGFEPFETENLWKNKEAFCKELLSRADVERGLRLLSEGPMSLKENVSGESLLELMLEYDTVRSPTD